MLWSPSRCTETIIFVRNVHEANINDLHMFLVFTDVLTGGDCIKSGGRTRFESFQR